MPLSEDEQRILREIEENLSVTDPKLVQQVSDTTLYRHSARVIKWSVARLRRRPPAPAPHVHQHALPRGARLPGDARLPPAIEHNVRKLGRAGFESLTSGMRPGGNMKGMFGNVGKRWRDRWQRDDGP